MDHLPSLYRRRYLPDELIHLKDDEILKITGQLIITRWNTLKPRTDIAKGYSAYFMDEGIKVSKVLNAKNQLVYWYCDIIDVNYQKEENKYIFCDLLVDVLIYPDGSVHVADLDEIGELLERGTLKPETAAKALKITDRLLKIIDGGSFASYQSVINEAIDNT